MCSTKRTDQRFTSFGLILLAIANVTIYLLTRHTGLSEQVVDPVAGFLMGTAIAVLLLGIYKGTRQQRL